MILTKKYLDELTYKQSGVLLKYISNLARDYWKVFMRNVFRKSWKLERLDIKTRFGCRWNIKD